MKSNIALSTKILYVILPASGVFFSILFFVKIEMFNSDVLLISFLSIILSVYVLFSFLYPIITLYNVYFADGMLIYHWLVLPIKKKYYLNELCGYFSVMLPSKNGEYLTFYPSDGERILPAISSFLYENAQDFIRSSGLKHLGRIKFSWKIYFFDICFRRRIIGNKE